MHKALHHKVQGTAGRFWPLEAAGRMEGREGSDTAGALALPGAAPERRASAFSASEGTSDVSSSDPSRVYQGFMDFIHPNLSQSMFNHPQNFFTSIALASGFDICFALGKRKGAALLPDAAFGWGGGNPASGARNMGAKKTSQVESENKKLTQKTRKSSILSHPRPWGASSWPHLV